MSGKRLRASLLALAALLVAAPTASSVDFPQGGGANNVVIATTTADASTIVRSSTQLSSVGGITVAPSNIATATSHDCVGCHATAVAVQVVFVTSSPQFFSPANAAAATNADCTSCVSFAYAWQYALQTNGPVHLSPDAQQRVVELRQEIAATAASVTVVDLETAAQLQARLDALTAELRAVIDADLGTAPAQALAPPVAHVRFSPGS